MKKLMLVVLLLLSCLAAAKERAWQEATVVNMDSRESGGGAAVVPVGTMLVGVPLTEVFHYYTFRTPTMAYVGMRRHKMVNLTLNGKTKIAIEGDSIHVLDDEGKDVKLKLVQKIARPEPEPEKKP